MAKKVEKESIEIIENPEILQAKLLQSQELAEKNKNVIIGVLAAFIVAIGGYFLYNYYTERQDSEAQVQLFPAVFYFEKDSLDKALNGDGNFTEGFVRIADQYSATSAGKKAGFYAGVIFLKKGEYDKAINYLDKFSSSDFLVQARAYALTGDAWAEKGDLDKAIGFYKKAADYKPNERFSPQYLMKLGLAQEKKGDKTAAADTYQQILDRYPESSEATNAKTFLARAGRF